VLGKQFFFAPAELRRQHFSKAFQGDIFRLRRPQKPNFVRLRRAQKAIFWHAEMIIFFLLTIGQLYGEILFFFRRAEEAKFSACRALKRPKFSPKI